MRKTYYKQMYYRYGSPGKCVWSSLLSMAMASETQKVMKGIVKDLDSTPYRI